MNQKTKTVPISEKKEEKEKYSLESKKIPARALENGIIAGVILAFINLTSGKFFGGSILNGIISILEISVVFALFVFFVSLCILRSKLNTKYKIPNSSCCKPRPSFDGISSLSNHDSDSSYPGSAANSTRQMFDRMRSR